MPSLSIHPCAVTDIPPEPRKPQLSFVQLQNITINPLELSKPLPQPVFTLKDFIHCADKTKDNRRQNKSRYYSVQLENIMLKVSKNLLVQATVGVYPRPVPSFKHSYSTDKNRIRFLKV